MKGWLNVFLVGIFVVWPLKVLALIVVPFLKEGRVTNKWFGARDAKDLSYWNIGVRNGAHNALTKSSVVYKQTGNVPRVLKGDPDPMEESGFKWRRRESMDDKYVSFRATFGNQRDKGKREFYIGWTMDVNSKTFSITFFQLRVF